MFWFVYEVLFWFMIQLIVRLKQLLIVRVRTVQLTIYCTAEKREPIKILYASE